MHFDSSTRIAVLDLTHGGIVIARKLKEITGSVTAVDIYRTVDPGILEKLEQEGIKISGDNLDTGDIDLIVSPVHLDVNHPVLSEAKRKNIPVISHHEAVGEILPAYGLEDKTIIELTGTKAKTSTAILLADILSKGKKVVSHTSRGLEDRDSGTIVRKGLSITPASILTAMDVIQEARIKPDVLVFEVSLGGTGYADIGVITTVSNDYSIANRTRKASDAKRQMILNAKPGSTLVINNDALRFFGGCRRDVKIVSFTDSIDASCNVYYENISGKEATIAYYLGQKQGKIHIPGSQEYDIASYRTSFVCATAVALALDVDESVIERAIQDFRGAEGRMKRTILSGRTLVDNSNSGMDIRSAEKALSFAKEEGEKIVMVLGEEAQQVCEGLDPAGVGRFIENHMNELSALVLVGERMRQFVKGNIYYAGDLPGGIELATQLTHEKDIILSCVKCFR